MNMKKLTISLITVSSIFLQSVRAQEELDASKREKLEALKVAYITKELELSPVEAQTFWPLYNELDDKMRSLRKQRRSNRLNNKENQEALSDAELSKAIDRDLAIEQQELDLKKEYNERFKKILPIAKVAKLHQAEHGFRRELLRGAKDRTRAPGGPPH